MNGLAIRVRLFVAASLIVGMGAVDAGISGPATAADSPVAAYWPLDEGGGTTAADTSGNDQDGALLGAAGWATGQIGAHAASFNGSTSTVDIPRPVIDTTKDFSVSAWVRLSDTGGYRTAVSIDGNRVSGFYLQKRGDTGAFAFTMLTSDDTIAGTFASGADPVVAGVWYLITGVRDVAAKTLTLYVNGVPQETVQYTSSWQATGHTEIGRGKFAGNQVDWFAGQIDDVRVWSAPLPAAEVRALAAGSRWRFDEGGGEVAADTSPYHRDGVLTGGATWAGGKVGTHGIVLNGQTTAVEVAEPVVDTGSGFTVSAWLNPADVTGTRTAVSIDGERVSGFALGVRDGRPVFSRPTSAAGDTEVVVTGPAVAANAWRHVAGSYDAIGRRLTLYVDGQPAASAAFQTPWRAAGHTLVGRGQRQGAPAEWFAGQVDDVHITGQPLPAVQVADLAAAGAWHLDDRAGTVAADSSPNQNDATVDNGQWPDGVVDGALRLAGTTATTAAGTGLDFGTGSFTAAAWFRTTARGTQTVVAKGSAYALRVAAGRVSFTAGAGRIAVRTTQAYADGEWHHAAAILDRTAGRVTLSVDGEPRPVRAERGSCGGAVGSTVDISRCAVVASGAGPVTIGGVRGELDEVTLDAFALSADTVRAIGRLGVLRVNGGRTGPAIPRTLFGSFFEEINHSGDGGLYAELVRNRALMDNATQPAGWTAAGTDLAGGTFGLDTTQPLNEQLNRSLRLTATTDVVQGQRFGVANGGYFGIALRPGERYRLSFWAKTTGLHGPLTATLENAQGTQVYATGRVGRVSGEWKRYELTLRPSGLAAPSQDNRLVIGLGAGTAAGDTVWLQVVSLTPPTSDGLRRDLVDKLAAMRPGIFRFPGGNYLEGNTIADRFDWKKTLGPIERRAGHPGTWGYRSSDGLGLLEYLELSEDLGAEPVVGIYAGYSLDGTHVPLDQLGPFVQDALDEIEYITGPVTSTWGARRAADGHPRPFPLRYLEIGNEDFFDPQNTYDARFTRFHDGIKAKYPSMRLIATTTVQTRTPDLYDEHYYNSAQFFDSNANRYDSYDRAGPKVFVGEFAVIGVRPTGDLAAALGEAAFMTGMERNADVVAMSAYAPILVNVNDVAWPTNLIGFDGLSSFGSPSYYVQQLFARNHGTVVVPAAYTPNASGGPLHVVSSRDARTGTVYLTVVNRAATSRVSRLDLSALGRQHGRVTATVLTSANPSDVNTLTDPTRVVPRTTKVTLGPTHTFPANSLTIFTLPGRG